jgi:(2Fe-2S) ferredoxin
LASWEFLKRRVKDLKLGGILARTKANCLQVCVSGPVAVVYPDGVFYHSCTPENLELILQQHILRGEVVQDLMIAEAGRCIHSLNSGGNVDKEKKQ